MENLYVRIYDIIFYVYDRELYDTILLSTYEIAYKLQKKKNI